MLTGAGDQAFCAGADLTGHRRERGRGRPRTTGRGLLADLFRDMWSLGKPIVARVRGYALAGGFGLACACDLIVAADDAVFGTPEINVGLWPYMITVPLLRSMAPKTALDLMMTGRRVDAHEGQSASASCNASSPVDELDATVDALAAELATKSPLIMQWGRDSFYRVLEMDADDALDYLQGMLTVTTLTEDSAEGVAAFAEKRAPEWKGRRRDAMHDWGPLVGDLKARKDRALGMGGRRPRRAPALARQAHGARATRPAARSRARGSSTGCSPTTWTPGLGDRYLAADGAVTGVGEIDGRPVAIAAYDFTVMAGSMGAVGEDKIARMREHALRQRIPMIWLLDSAGARIQSTSGSTFAGAGALFREQVAMSGVVPMVAAMLGHCAAGTAYIPALADFVPMVKGTSSMALGGRHLVKAAVGEDVTEEEMGGSAVHTKISGVADLEVADDAECLASCASTCRSSRSTTASAPPVRPTDDPVDRRVEELYDIVPTAPRRAYDVRKVVTAIVDDGDVLWMKPEWAKNVVTGLARVGGAAVGIVANQPMVLGGALDVNAADKAARFVWLCDAFNIPLVFLHDVPGFIVGSAVEKQGIIRHGAKMLFAVSRGDGAEDQRDPAQELRRRLLRDERPRVRSRLHRRVADRRDRGDGTRRRGEHHPPHARSKRSTTRRSARRSGSSSPRRSAPTSIRTSPPATASSTT